MHISTIYIYYTYVLIIICYIHLCARVRQLNDNLAECILAVNRVSDIYYYYNIIWSSGSSEWDTGNTFI